MSADVGGATVASVVTPVAGNASAAPVVADGGNQAGGEEQFLAKMHEIEAKRSGGDKIAVEEKKEIPADSNKADADKGADSNKPLIDRAKTLGFSEDAVLAWGDRAEGFLDAFESNLDLRAVNAGKELAAKKQGKGGELAPVEPSAKKPDEKVETAAQKSDLRKTMFAALEEGGYGKEDSIYKAFDGVMGQLESALAKVEAQGAELKRYQEIASSTKESETNSEVDRFFSSQTRYASLFGDKPLSQLPPDSPHAVKRQEVINDALAMVEGYQAQGRSLALPEALQKALKMSVADYEKTLAKKEVIAQGTERHAAIISRPGTVADPKGKVLTQEEQEAEFKQRLAEIDRKHGKR